MMGYIPHQLAQACFRNNGALAPNPYLEGTVEWKEFDSTIKFEIRRVRREAARAKRAAELAAGKPKKPKKPKKKGARRAPSKS